jgi:predicted Ser/Thr protein kinase
MDWQRLGRVREVFEAALQLDPPNQDRYIRDVCAEDPDVRLQVLQLLRAHNSTTDLLDSPEEANWRLLATEAQDVLPADSIVAERFRVVRLIGRGGMGQVYEAVDQHLKRTVALKLLPLDRAADPTARNRLQREARTLAALRHANICGLYDIIREEDREILVMEYLHGDTLAERLQRCGSLDLSLAAEIAVQISAALDYAHMQGVLHRDLKPGNIMLTAEGAKLLDFGIARFTGSSGRVPFTMTLTEEAGILGTVHYMSPEQALGRPLDSRSDVFSLGVVLYEMTTGSAPFQGETAAQVLTAVVNDEPRPVSRLNPAVPVVLEDTIRRCLEKAPEHRYSSAADVAQALQPLFDFEVLPRNSEAARKQNQIAPRWWALAGILGLLAGLAIYRSFDFRSALRLACTRPDAVRISREIAQGLGYPPVGLKENVVFQHTPEFDEASRHGGARAARTLVQTGAGFTWRVDFTPTGARRGAGWRDAGVSVRLNSSGQLMEFRSQPYVTFLPAERKTAERHAAFLLGQWLRTKPPPNAATVTEVADLPGVLHVKWTKSSDVPGFQEELGATLAADQVLQLYRRFNPSVQVKDAPHSHGNTSVVKSFCTFFFSCALYAYGLRTLLKHRRSGALPWFVSLVITSVAALGSVAVALSTRPFATGASPSASTMWALAILTALLTMALLPAVSGVIIAIKQRNYEAVIDLEGLLRMRLPYQKAKTSLTQGVFSGMLLAGIYMFGNAVVVPDTRPLEIGITGDTPWRFGETSLALWAGVLLLIVIVPLHWVEQRSGRFSVSVVIVATSLGWLWTDFRSPSQFAAEGVANAMVVACSLIAYRTAGLAAATISIGTSLLIFAATVGLHLGNQPFLYSSFGILAVPMVALALFLIFGKATASRWSGDRPSAALRVAHHHRRDPG